MKVKTQVIWVTLSHQNFGNLGAQEKALTKADVK